MTSTRSRVRLRTVGVAIVLALTAALAGCSDTGPAGSNAGSADNVPDQAVPGDIPDNQAFVEVTSFPGFTVKVPEGWASSASGTATVFTDKLNAITVDSHTGATAPTEPVVQREVDQQMSAAPGYVAGSVSTVTRPAGTAIVATYRVTGPVDPVSGKSIADDVERYEFFRDGQLVTVTLSAPIGADNVDPWRSVTDSVRWNP